MADKSAESTERISREDVENKIREFTGDVDDGVERLTKAALAVGSAVLVLLLIIVFLTGRSKGRKKTTVVEVIRI